MAKKIVIFVTKRLFIFIVDSYFTLVIFWVILYLCINILVKYPRTLVKTKWIKKKVSHIISYSNFFVY